MKQPAVNVRFGARTDQGMVRDHNEDSYLTAPPYFIVADGMGGHSRGEAASKAAVDAFLPGAGQRWATTDDLNAAIAVASTRIDALGGQGRPPGSTLTGVGLTVQGGMPCWLVFNIGDSRTYLLRDGDLIQISVDHSSRSDTRRNVITRALGAGLTRPLVADQWMLPINPGDMILACSDGLTNEVTDQLIAALLLSPGDPHEKATALVDAANRAGGRDNVTAVVVIADEVVADGEAAIVTTTLRDRDEQDDTVPD